MSEGIGGSPIVIRKKRSADDEDHHGGVWKLAFADFMTAMMAFFLVMWLINSTSKETKAVIVQYFNPVQLIDSNPAHKGLRDPKPTGQGRSLQQSENVETPSQERATESALRKDPFKTLEEIAKRDEPSPNIVVTQRDPFDRAPGATTLAARAGEGDLEESKAETPNRQKSSRRADPKEPEQPKSGVPALQEEIESIIAQEARGRRAMPKAEIKQAPEGVLISLTDDANFSMFEVGSIEPRPQLVRIIAHVGKLLAGRKGEIELRGHTDGRSYAGRNYDNWRLSSDRATMVNYMLMRGGLPPARVGKIVGFADRQLKTPKDPLAPVNRRIEILLREGNQ